MNKFTITSIIFEMNITDLCSELFEIPSKRCSGSLFKCLKIPNFISLLVFYFYF